MEVAINTDLVVSQANFSQPFFICWDRWLDTQWTESHQATESRYRKSREIVERMACDKQRSVTSVDQDEDPVVTSSTAMTTTNGLVVMNGSIQKLVMNGGKELKGILPGEDSGWDDNSSDGSAEVSLVGGEVGGRSREQKELRNRRAAAAR